MQFSLPILKEKQTNKQLTNQQKKIPQAIKGVYFVKKKTHKTNKKTPTSLQVQHPQRTNDGLLSGYIFT